MLIARREFLVLMGIAGLTAARAHARSENLIVVTNPSADVSRLIDVEPEELLKRFEAGKVYRPERAETAMKNFFSKENLALS